MAVDGTPAKPELQLFGLRTFSHGGQFVLTVISPAGAATVVTQLHCCPGLEPVFEPGQPVRFLERREGSIEALITRYAIERVEHPRWQQLRQALGDRALCSD